MNTLTPQGRVTEVQRRLVTQWAREQRFSEVVTHFDGAKAAARRRRGRPNGDEWAVGRCFSSSCRCWIRRAAGWEMRRRHLLTCSCPLPLGPSQKQFEELMDPGWSPSPSHTGAECDSFLIRTPRAQEVICTRRGDKPGLFCYCSEPTERYVWAGGVHTCLILTDDPGGGRGWEQELWWGSELKKLHRSVCCRWRWAPLVSDSEACVCVMWMCVLSEHVDDSSRRWASTERRVNQNTSVRR